MEENKKKPQGLLGFLGARGRMWILLGGLLAGILLITAGTFFETDTATKDAATYEMELDALLEYEAALEKEVGKLCEQVKGVGQVDVLLHLKGGTRVQYATDERGSPASVGSGSAEKALGETVILPEIAGVAIVCRGGEDPRLQQILTDLIATALGIPTNRVAVTGK